MKPIIAVQSYTFKAVIEPDFFDDGTPAYQAYIPALPGCFSWGYTIEEALQNLEETTKHWIELMQEQGEPIPKEASVANEPQIAVNLTRS
jgi:predicted RNase H-like HicB family nuclease